MKLLDHALMPMKKRLRRGCASIIRRCREQC